MADNKVNQKSVTVRVSGKPYNELSSMVQKKNKEAGYNMFNLKKFLDWLIMKEAKSNDKQ